MNLKIIIINHQKTIANNNALFGWIDFFEGYTKVYETVYLKVRYIQGDQKKLSKLLCLEI